MRASTLKPLGDQPFLEREDNVERLVYELLRIEDLTKELGYRSIAEASGLRGCEIRL